ncbi:hypothetical protein ARMGADRAFT_1019256 [Armillaria gallica]|uniref:Uncharacterized protein n=1 Tax=Armillaria gallica TaxID=47427 RepID=A0A2H3CJ44_ARMGA|nr:hypothetical protein ARMGADRAFT_1019256 [Armillaria gallica]
MISKSFNIAFAVTAASSTPLFPRNLGRTSRLLLSTDLLVSTLGDPTKCILELINLTVAYGFCTVWLKQNKMEIKGNHDFPTPEDNLNQY